jgi:hypothetical protein
VVRLGSRGGRGPTPMIIRNSRNTDSPATTINAIAIALLTGRTILKVSGYADTLRS